MRTSSTADTWRPYSPSEASPWDLRRVVHLHRRAGLGATWAELQRDLAEGPDASVRRLLDGTPEVTRGGRDAGTQEALADRLALSAARAGSIDRLQAAWVFRLLYGAHPLRERMTLMWHDHFATSYLKVEDLSFMHGQNALLREHALGPFGELLRAVVRDPAMLVWLDAPSNRSRHPNENLARELMELFTLGIGHYTEADVKEAARALTGWTLQRGEFLHKGIRHDAGEKTILGTTAAFDGDTLLELLLAQSATADRVAGRVCDLFLAEPSEETAELHAARHEELSRHLRASDLDVGAAVELILRSEAFFEDANLGARISEPVPHAVWILRSLELDEPQPTTLLVSEWIRRLGQDLFNPPNVGGWPGGRAWLVPRAVIARSNFAAAAIEGTPIGRPPFDPAALAATLGWQGDGTEALLDGLSRLLFGAPLGDDSRARVLAHARATSDGGTSPHQRLVAALLAQPEAHLA